MKGGDDSEVAPATASRSPQQIRVGGRVGVDQLATGGHHLEPHKVVARQSQLAGTQTNAPAERQTREPDGGASSARHDASVAGKPCVEIDQQLACTCSDRSGCSIELESVHSA